DLVGEKPVLREIAPARRTEDPVDRDRVSVTDETHAWQRQKVGMEQCLDGGLLCFRVDATAEEFVFDLLVGEVASIKQRQERGGSALDKVIRAESVETAAAGFDEEGVFAELRGGVAFT